LHPPSNLESPLPPPKLCGINSPIPFLTRCRSVQLRSLWCWPASLQLFSLPALSLDNCHPLSLITKSGTPPKEFAQDTFFQRVVTLPYVCVPESSWELILCICRPGTRFNCTSFSHVRLFLNPVPLPPPDTCRTGFLCSILLRALHPFRLTSVRSPSASHLAFPDLIGP